MRMCFQEGLAPTEASIVVIEGLRRRLCVKAPPDAALVSRQSKARDLIAAVKAPPFRRSACRPQMRARPVIPKRLAEIPLETLMEGNLAARRTAKAFKAESPEEDQAHESLERACFAAMVESGAVSLPVF